jgi:hypothetical protein
LAIEEDRCRRFFVSAVKKKVPPSKKKRFRSYMSVEIAQAMYDQNVSVGLRDVHLPNGWHLNAKRASVPPVPRCGAGAAG